VCSISTRREGARATPSQKVLVLYQSIRMFLWLFGSYIDSAGALKWPHKSWKSWSVVFAYCNCFLPLEYSETFDKWSTRNLPISFFWGFLASTGKYSHPKSNILNNLNVKTLNFVQWLKICVVLLNFFLRKKRTSGSFSRHEETAIKPKTTFWVHDNLAVGRAASDLLQKPLIS